MNSKIVSDRNSKPVLSSVGYEKKPVSVNISVTNKCNYDCQFCFALLDGNCCVDDSSIHEIPGILKEMGTEKITLEGGEPFLYDGLDDLLKQCKELGLTTSVISNGSLITEERLNKLSTHLDWLTLSIDSTRESVEKELGRGNGDHVEQVLRVGNLVKDLGMKLKLNTVVTKLSLDDDLTELYLELFPERVKMFQVLSIEGVNNVEKLKISERDFREFVDRHSAIEKEGIPLVAEANDDMICSYLMVLPDGRFVNNKGREYRLTEHTIFDRPWKALRESRWNEEKFVERGGDYAW